MNLWYIFILVRDLIITWKIEKIEIIYRCGSCRVGKNKEYDCYRESMVCDL